jgi:hypothetical protein
LSDKFKLKYSDSKSFYVLALIAVIIGLVAISFAIGLSGINFASTLIWYFAGLIIFFTLLAITDIIIIFKAK